MARYIDVEKAEYPYMSMSMWGVNSKDCKAYNEGVKATEDMITALPTADVEEVKHGEWIEHEDMIGDVYYTCSNCNNDWTTIDGTPQENFMNYCPNCGAKMDRGKVE